MTKRADETNARSPRGDGDRAVLSRAHQALWDNVGELNFIIGQMAGQSFIKDRDLRFVYTNDHFAREHGMTPEDMVGKTDFDLFAREDAEHFRSEDRAIIEKGELTVAQGPRWSGVKIPIKDAQGNVVAVVVWTNWDDNKQRLVERLFHFASVVVCSADAIIGLSLDGVIQSWNPGAEDVYGHTAGEMAGKPVAVLCEPAGQLDLTEQIEEAAAGAVVRDYETTHVCKDGRRVRVSVALSPMVGMHGTVVGVSMVARDITARVRMEEELKGTLAQLVGTQTELSHAAYVKPQRPSPHREKIEQVAREIRRNPYRDFDFVRESQRLHMSYSRFRQLFRACVGRPPHDYLLVWRMRRAAKELRDPDKPIKAVAMEAGYEDPAQFSKLFKEKIGFSPSQYRQAVRNL